MQKKSQKNLELVYPDSVIDIVQYGSSIIETNNPNDIDITVIYQKIPLKDQLDNSQNIKKQLEINFDKPIHIKSYDLYSFFDKGNFTKEAVLFYGKSLITKRYFSEIFGLTPKLRIKYNLTKLKKKEKIRFNYLLNGKGGEYGLLRTYLGKLIAPGLIEVKPEHEKIFLDAMKNLNADIITEKTFI